MSVFARAGRRLRRLGQERARSGRASRATGRFLGAAAVGALMLVSMLAATAGAPPAGAALLAGEGAPGSLVPYNGGPVQHDPTFYAIFWLPSGASYEPGIVNGDSGYENLMTRYLRDASGTNLANVASQYYDTSNGYPKSVGTSSQYGGSWTYTTAYPESPLYDSDIEAAVNAALTANPAWKDGISSTFFVFTGYGIESCDDSTKNSCTPGITSAKGYCGEHGSSNDDVNGNTAVWANMPDDEYWNAKTLGQACHNVPGLPNFDIYADNELSNLSHEQFEAETDPVGGAWTYPDGTEIADLCVGDYGNAPGASNFNVNGDPYILQELWSNSDGRCAGVDAGNAGYYAAYGPYSAMAGVSTGPLKLALTSLIPSVGIVFTPDPTISWGDGSSSSPGGDSGCGICTLTGSHTYAYNPSGFYPIVYTVTVTYHTGCCISYSQSIHITVFPPPPPAPLTITPNNHEINYGDPIPDLTVSYRGFINGDTSSIVQGLTCSAASATGTPVTSLSPFDLYYIQCGGAVAPGYAITYGEGTLRINRATLTVTANNQTTTYGSIWFDIEDMTFSGFVNGEGAWKLGPDLQVKSDVLPGSPAGTYHLNPGGATDRNYNYIWHSGTLTVTPAPLLITAKSKSMTYGGPVPAFDATISGLVNGDTSSSLSGLACRALDASGNPVSSATPAGTYAITCSGATDSNYAISYHPGTLTVTGS